jgi:hypothetical protein
MSTTRDFPFSFSAEARLVLGSPDGLNRAVRAAFPDLRDDWYGQPAPHLVFGEAGRLMMTRPGSHTAAGTVLGLFAGTIFMGMESRGSLILPLPAFRIGGVEVHCFVDASSRVARSPSAAEAALYRHVCDDDEASLVGDWWLGGPVPCLTARAATVLPELTALTWNFDLHGAARYTLSYVEARQWRRLGHRTARCRCNTPGDCPFYRFLRLPDISGSSDDSDW